MTQPRVLIIGAGLVGTSVGMALTRSGATVHFEDANPSHATVAAGLSKGRIGSLGPDEVDVVVVATPPASIVAVVREALQRFPAALVTDVGSVKAPITAAIAHPHYIGSHPMAGSQHTGPLTASASLFEGRAWIVSPGPDALPAHVELLHQLIGSTGAVAVTMEPHRHDEAVAQVSHLPHLMSILTASHLREVPPAHLELAGQGLRDVTRIARSDTTMWRQIITTNSAAIRHELGEVAADLAHLIGILDDPDALEQFLAVGRQGALSLRGKHGNEPLALRFVTVRIPDEPRALARLFGDVGELGLNVEDFTLAHDTVAEVGYLSIAVEHDSAEQLRDALLEHGWDAWIKEDQV